MLMPKSINHLNARRLDAIGYATLKEVFHNIAPYAIRKDVTAHYDCEQAKKHYETVAGAIDSAMYEMHHTLDGFIIPVSTQLHKHTTHRGGVEKFGLKR